MTGALHSLDEWRLHLAPLAAQDTRLSHALVAWVDRPTSASAALNALALATMADPSTMARLSAECGDDEPLAFVHAMALGRSGQVDAAVPRLDRLAFHARLRGDEHLLSWALSERARAHQLRGDLRLATADLEASIAISHEAGHTLLEIIARANLGFLHGHEERPDAYARHTRVALELARQIDDRQAIAHCLCNLGGALVHLGQLDEALACCEEALPIAQAHGWGYVEGLALAGIGAVHYRRDDPEAGRRWNLEAEAVLARCGRHDQIMRHRYVEGRHLLVQRRPAEALPLLEAAIVGARRLGLTVLEMQALEQQADAQEATGDTAGALRTLRAVTTRRAEERSRLLEQGQRAAAARAEAELKALEAAHALKERQRTLLAERERLDQTLSALKALHAQVAETSRTDTLTGLPNRRAASERLRLCLDSAARHRRPFGLALLDVDHFKGVNDRHGHAAGDAVLTEIARRLRARARTTDLVARWGGEEFLIVLPETDLFQAEIMVSASLARLRATPFTLPDGQSVRITASAGVTAWWPGCSLDDVFQRADRALYSAKAAGRDRAVRAALPHARLSTGPVSLRPG